MLPYYSPLIGKGPSREKGVSRAADRRSRCSDKSCLYWNLLCGDQESREFSRSVAVGDAKQIESKANQPL